MEAAFSTVFNFDNWQPEVASNVISSTAVQDVGMDVCITFGDSRLKTSDASFSAVFSNVDNFRPETDSDLVSGAFVGPTGVKVLV